MSETTLLRYGEPVERDGKLVRYAVGKCPDCKDSSFGRGVRGIQLASGEISAVSCPTCAAHATYGLEPGQEPVECGHCGGEGSGFRTSDGFRYETRRSCMDCHGTGYETETTATERWSEPQAVQVGYGPDSYHAYERTRLVRCPECKNSPEPGKVRCSECDWGRLYGTTRYQYEARGCGVCNATGFTVCPRCADSPEPGWVPVECVCEGEGWMCGTCPEPVHMCGHDGKLAFKCFCHGTGHETQRMTVERHREILVFLLKMYVPPRTVDGPSPSDPELQFALAIMESRESRR